MKQADIKTKTAVDEAIAFIAYRPRSVKEIRDKLAKKRYPADEIAAAIERLIAGGLLDDDKFAGLLAESRHRNKKWGPAKISAELKSKGIEGEIVKKTVCAVFGPDEAAAAADALAIWLRKNKNSDPGKLKEYGSKESIRAMRHLASRGFTPGAAIEAIKKYGSTEDL